MCGVTVFPALTPTSDFISMWPLLWPPPQVFSSVPQGPDPTSSLRRSHAVAHRFASDVVREPRHGTSSTGKSVAKAAREIQHQAALQSGREWRRRVEEIGAELLSMVLVLSTGETVFRVRFFLDPNVRIHRRRRSDSARCPTPSQAIPSDSPVITRRARRSLADAQAASTWDAAW